MTFTKISNLLYYREFLNKLNNDKELVDDLSVLISNKSEVCLTKNRTHILDNTYLRFVINTLNSIEYCCENGYFSDANVLVRKYRDDLLLYLFILEVINNRVGLTEKEIESMAPDGMNENNIVDIVMKLSSNQIEGKRKNKNDVAIDAWFDDEVSTGIYKNQLSIDNYFKYIKNNSDVKKCIDAHNLNQLWEETRQRLNDYTHTNGKSFLANNSGYLLKLENIEKCLTQISQDISFITSIFLIILILIKPHYIMSADYVDYLDEGMTPPDNSQYWVAPFINTYINEIINNLHPELKLFLRNTNKYGMEIE